MIRNNRSKLFGFYSSLIIFLVFTILLANCGQEVVFAQNKTLSVDLQNAIYSGDYSTVQYFLTHGESAKWLTEPGFTSLMLVNDPAMMQLLIKYGADPNARSTHEWTPLMSFTLRGKIECIKVLLQNYQIDVNAVNDSGHTALDYSGSQQDIYNLLKSVGASGISPEKNLPNNSGGLSSGTSIKSNVSTVRPTLGSKPSTSSVETGTSRTAQQDAEFVIREIIQNPQQFCYDNLYHQGVSQGVDYWQGRYGKVTTIELQTCNGSLVSAYVKIPDVYIADKLLPTVQSFYGNGSRDTQAMVSLMYVWDAGDKVIRLSADSSSYSNPWMTNDYSSSVKKVTAFEIDSK